MNMATRVQILDEINFISFSANKLGKCMHSIILSYVCLNNRAPRLFNHCKVTNLWQGKLWISTRETSREIYLVSHPPCVDRFYIYIYIYIYIYMQEKKLRPPLHFGVVAIEKVTFESPSTLLIYIYIWGLTYTPFRGDCGAIFTVVRIRLCYPNGITYWTL